MSAAHAPGRLSSALGPRRVMVALTLAVGAFVLFFPARQLVAQRERIDSLEQRRSELRAENARLSEQAARLSDPAEVEALARDRLGLVRPGERAYYVEPTEKPAAAPHAAARRPSVWSRAWNWLTSLVRGQR